MTTGDSRAPRSAQKPNYGIDAPPVVLTFVIIAVVGIGGSLLLDSMHRAPRVAATLLWPGLSFALTAAVMIWSSKAGKFAMRDRMLELLTWRGDEKALDVGCGRGMMLVGVARRLARGHVTGIDLWRSVDQSGNSPDATRRNLEAEGLAQRVDLRDGDARELPFPDSSFDVVTSSLVVHNLHARADREKVLTEMLRVLKPGGWLALMDIRNGTEYLKFLRGHGMAIVGAWWRPLFFQRTDAIVARKPES
ncbi:MAG: class I SAM-dependent methyltransferase [Acidobacteriota bacterium]